MVDLYHSNSSLGIPTNHREKAP